VKLNPAAFNRHLNHIGQRMLWRQSFMCPCIQEHSGAADTHCPLCHGKGRLWSDPIEGVAGLTQQQVNPSFQDFGAMEQGDMVLTVGSDSTLYNMGRFDRITLLNSTDVFSRTVYRGINDNVSDISVKEITRVFWRTLDGSAIVEGGLPTVSGNGDLAWTSGAPDPGVQYSMTGVKYDDYYVYGNLPSDRNEHSGSALPKKVQMRKFDLFGK